jgi:hypothetical protein
METFMTEYAVQLKHAVETYPSEYAYSVTEVPKVIARMRDAIQSGQFNKDGRAIKETCKKLKIKHTYKGIRNFIDNHV